jgi:two-component system sensor histidine kinase DesK
MDPSVFAGRSSPASKGTVASARVVDRAGLAVIALTLVLTAVELGRVALLGDPADTVVACVATAIFLPIHVWHLRYGLRGERPPRSLATLAVAAAVQFAALAIIGPAWAFMLATLATSSLIVLRPPWSWLMVVACVLAPWPASRLHPGYLGDLEVSTFYLMWSVGYRSILQFTLVRLVAGAHELVVTREAVARRAASREHERLEAAMRDSLERSLTRLAAAARRARAALLEPGVAAALIALDRILTLATQASDELRRSVQQARDAAPAPAPDGALSGVARFADSPIGRGLDLPRVRWSFVAPNLFVLGVVPLAALGAFGAGASGAAVFPAWLALTAVQLSSLRDVARGLRPAWALARLAFALALTATMMARFGLGWRDPGWFVGVAIAVAFGGRTRIALLGFFFAVAAGYDTWRASNAYLGFDVSEAAWWYAYYVTQLALGVIALYGSARLIMLLGELAQARERYVREAVQGERRRAWRDLHDLLGRNLVAITLKADLARRLLRREPDRSRAEVEDLVELTGQADEIAVIARGERAVEFEVELAGAVRLLEAAGIEVAVEIEPGGLDPATSLLLGLAVREGTTNVLRHADAGRVWIRAGDRSGRLVFEIRNDGARGEGAPGTGLRSLAECAAAIGGTASATIEREGIFALEVSLPAWVRV